MWLIFVASATAIALTALVVVKIGHEVYLSMKREEREFEKEE